MTQRWAMIKNGTVENVCLWDGDVSTWRPPQEFEMQPAPDEVAIGWGWDGSRWIAPVPPVVPEQATGDSLV